jgi:undecaprenyl-diphosphatase
MDTSLAHALNGLALRHDWLGDAFEWWAGASEPAFALMVLALLAGGAVRWRSLLPAGLLAAASAVLSLGAAAVLSHIVARPRPFVADPEAIHALVKHAADPGFPSDHATAAFAIATAILMFHRRLGLTVLAAAALLAVDRVAVGIHYPADVIAGASLGSAVAWELHRLLAGRVARSLDAQGAPRPWAAPPRP